MGQCVLEPALGDTDPHSSWLSALETADGLLPTDGDPRTRPDAPVLRERKDGFAAPS
jgi:hypothetical protein